MRQCPWQLKVRAGRGAGHGEVVREGLVMGLGFGGNLTPVRQGQAGFLG